MLFLVVPTPDAPFGIMKARLQPYTIQVEMPGVQPPVQNQVLQVLVCTKVIPMWDGAFLGLHLAERTPPHSDFLDVIYLPTRQVALVLQSTQGQQPVGFGLGFAPTP